MCGAKMGHDTEGAAWAAVHATRKREKAAGPSAARNGRLKPYRCKFCGRWHIGNRKSKAGTVAFIEAAAKR